MKPEDGEDEDEEGDDEAGDDDEPLQPVVLQLLQGAAGGGGVECLNIENMKVLNFFKIYLVCIFFVFSVSVEIKSLHWKFFSPL